jgi:hypothetical protein
MSTTEMKNDDRFSELKWHRLAEFVIYSDFNGVEFATSDRHVMWMKERLSDRVAVIAGVQLSIAQHDEHSSGRAVCDTCETNFHKRA